MLFKALAGDSSLRFSYRYSSGKYHLLSTVMLWKLGLQVVKKLILFASLEFNGGVFPSDQLKFLTSPNCFIAETG